MSGMNRIPLDIFQGMDPEERISQQMLNHWPGGQLSGLFQKWKPNLFNFDVQL
jgi:hypothetical protein